MTKSVFPLVVSDIYFAKDILFPLYQLFLQFVSGDARVRLSDFFSGLEDAPYKSIDHPHMAKYPMTIIPNAMRYQPKALKSLFLI